MSNRRKLAIAGGIVAAFAGALSGAGQAILAISAAAGGSFPFGAGFMLLGGGPFLIAGVTLLIVAAFPRRQPRTTGA
jgi:hypothetical protein